MSFWSYILLFFTVLGGGAAALAVRHRSAQNLGLALSFSGAFILGLVFLHFLPELFELDRPWTGLWVLVGFVLQILLDQLSKGVEHGHVHALHQRGRIGREGISILLGLCVHAFIEGLPLPAYEGHRHMHETTGGINYLLFGIILHKAPAAFALGLLFLQSGVSRRALWLSLLVFAAMSPLGAWAGTWFEGRSEWTAPLLALVTGSFFHIATTILFETDKDHHHRISLPRIVAIGLGLVTAILTLLA